MIDKFPMTAEGYAAHEAELKYCREVERPRILQQMADARTPEDLSENVEYREPPLRQGKQKHLVRLEAGTFRKVEGCIAPTFDFRGEALGDRGQHRGERFSRRVGR
jgi:hypothetical protein